MTPARKSPVFNALFWGYIRRLLKRQFGQILFRPGSFPCDRPTLYIANHHTWWDGFFAFALNERILHQDLHLMMGAEQFSRFRFFRHLGVFSVDQGNPHDVAQAFRYSVRVLSEKRAPSLWIFPAGEMRPAGSDVRLREGFARIAHAAPGVQVVPVGIWTGFLGGQFPDCLLAFGDRTECDGRSAQEIFDLGVSGLHKVVASLSQGVQEGDLEDFHPLLHGRSSVSERYARLKGV